LLSVRRSSKMASFRYATRWALGHAAALFALAIPAVALGVAIPEAFSTIAECAVGAILVALGVFLLIDVLRSRAHVHFHSHDGLVPHAHWHEHGSRGNDSATADAHGAHSHRHEHGAIFIGALHGWAGTAPFLALIPAVSQGSVLVAVLYLLVFCAGVLIAMLGFGGLLGSLLAGFLHQRLSGCLRLIRGAIAAGSVAIGAHLLTSIA
jgi:nickel/cobalt exporter